MMSTASPSVGTCPESAATRVPATSNSPVADLVRETRPRTNTLVAPGTYKSDRTSARSEPTIFPDSLRNPVATTYVRPRLVCDSQMPDNIDREIAVNLIPSTRYVPAEQSTCSIGPIAATLEFAELANSGEIRKITAAAAALNP